MSLFDQEYEGPITITESFLYDIGMKSGPWDDFKYIADITCGYFYSFVVYDTAELKLIVNFYNRKDSPKLLYFKQVFNTIYFEHELRDIIHTLKSDSNIFYETYKHLAHEI